MILIAGLGNPGDHYAKTRHNIGREIAHAFQKFAKLEDFYLEKKWRALMAEGKIGKEKITLLLPGTSMNKSGFALGAAARFYKLKPASIFIIHDDADIELGRAKLSFGKRSAGHKGVESVIRALKTKDFWRFRIGIGGKRDLPAEKIVLKKFTPAEQRIVKKITSRTREALVNAVEQGPEQAMNTYNQ